MDLGEQAHARLENQVQDERHDDRDGDLAGEIERVENQQTEYSEQQQNTQILRQGHLLLLRYVGWLFFAHEGSPERWAWRSLRLGFGARLSFALFEIRWLKKGRNAFASCPFFEHRLNYAARSVSRRIRSISLWLGLNGGAVGSKVVQPSLR